jgi:hypothetical protein
MGIVLICQEGGFQIKFKVSPFVLPLFDLLMVSAFICKCTTLQPLGTFQFQIKSLWF